MDGHSKFNNMNKSNFLKQEAINHGLCQQWTDEWGESPTDEMLVRKYIKGIDFCIKHDYPSVDYIVSHFDKELLHTYGIMVNESIFDSSAMKWVINGTCSGKIDIQSGSTKDIYIRHNSNVEINVSGFRTVFISIYDNASIQVSTKGGAKVFIYQYGGTVLSAKGNVTVRERRL